jgi:hypothetical protein
MKRDFTKDKEQDTTPLIEYKKIIPRSNKFKGDGSTNSSTQGENRDEKFLDEHQNSSHIEERKELVM